MKTTKRFSRRLGGRALPESNLLWSSRHGVSWTIGAFAAAGLIGATMVASLWNNGPVVAAQGVGANRVVLTADTAPPALWSNAWLGRRPYRAVAFHGLRRLAAGYSLARPHRPQALGQDLQRVAPEISARLIRLKGELSAEARRALAARAWL